MASNKVNIRLPEIPQFEVKIDGNWQKVDNLINNMSPVVVKAYEAGVTKYSKSVIKIVKKAISTGRPPEGSAWAPLSPSTIKAHGAHPIYNMRGFYARSIGIQSYPSKTIIGFPVNKRVPRAKHLTINQLAIILEHGSKVDPSGEGNGIPKRPLWGPSLKASGGMAKLKVDLLISIKRSLKSRFGLTDSQIRQT